MYFPEKQQQSIQRLHKTLVKTSNNSLKELLKYFYVYFGDLFEFGHNINM